MSDRYPRRAPIVRLPPKSNAELILQHGAQIALIVAGMVAFVFALHAGAYILAPITLGIVVGLMLGPLATRLESVGLAPGLSAAIVVLLFILLVCTLAFAIVAPLSGWIAKLPEVWTELQRQLAEWKAPLEAIQNAREQIRSIAGGSGVSVAVEDGSAVENMAMLAPALIAQILLFFASLYFFVAMRHQTRIAVLKLCFDRRMRWRTAHVFRDVERFVSRYLLSITLINVWEGMAVAAGLFMLGVPSALLWGAIAAIANFVVYIGPLIMTAVLFAVGLAEFDTLGGSLMPPLIYLAINAVEAQIVTPVVIGRAMTLNPFLVLLALAFWIWLWGPLGGFIAIPMLLIAYAIMRNILPGMGFPERRVD